jgi:patatin-like phospholipase/acyl hydrolase
MEPQNDYLILALDGGGIRGLLEVVILQRLEEAVPGWLKRVDLLAGTSTGGIIALGLAHEKSLADIRQLYYEKGPYIFYYSWLHYLLHLGPIFGAKHKNNHLRKELDKQFGVIKLKDLKKKVLIASFDLAGDEAKQPDKTKRSWKPKFFHNFEGPDSDGDLPVVDVALYTSAAPSYFPTAGSFVDGGVAANNPAMAALAQTQDVRAFKEPISFNKIHLLSLGTGLKPTTIEQKNLDWGYFQWSTRLLSIMFDGLGGIPDYQCKQILGEERYQRISPILPSDKNFDVDSVSQATLEALIELGSKADISGAVALLKKVVN